MIPSLLIANRGEIARRIIRTCRRLGIRTVAVFSEADRDAPFVHEADLARLIGPDPARESYLVGERIIAAALETGAAAIHPGYGFLSEKPEFAEAVIAAGLVWVGPPPSAIRAMGLKDAAKALMQKADVPTTPGYLGEDQSEALLFAEAKALGFPVLIKAVAGGGGKGMRRVDEPDGFGAALASCRREAASSFGDDRVLLETYVTRPRHIEVQVFADKHGNAVHLFERDCSLQRRHQKVIEEAPAPGMTDAVREAVCGAAVRAARAVGYEGAGTVEFIADASRGLAADRIWFMEMNTRLQVEHPVTEAITGQDLVEWQLRVASGERLPLLQDDLAIKGHAVEARLYAENPHTGFLPSIGRVDHLSLPSELVRVDSAVESGGEVSAHYDPMIAKLIAHAPTRAGAAAKLAEACAAVEIWPLRTNAGFLAKALAHPRFVAGDVETGFISSHIDELLPQTTPTDEVLQAGARHLASGGGVPPALRGFRLNAPADPPIQIEVDGEAHAVRPSEGGGGRLGLLPTAEGCVVFAAGEPYEVTLPRADHAGHGAGESDGQILSPMPSLIVSVAVSEGQSVAKGAPLVVLEAMKMEHTLSAPFAGKVAALNAVAGQRVAENVVLVRLKPAAEGIA